MQWPHRLHSTLKSAVVPWVSNPNAVQQQANSRGGGHAVARLVADDSMPKCLNAAPCMLITLRLSNAFRCNYSHRPDIYPPSTPTYSRRRGIQTL